MPHGGRHMFWIDNLENIPVASGAKAEVSLLGTLPESEGRSGMTLMRLILCWDLSYTIHDSGEGQQLVDVGIGIASIEAFGAGVLSDPEIETEHPQSGWLFRCRVPIFGFAADQPAVYVRTIERDLRARRKLNNGVAFLSVSNMAESGAASAISLRGITRTLWLST